MTLVGRTEEIATMKTLLQSEQSEFLAMYGRRRVGKTFLIRTVYVNHIVFECAGLHEENFSRQIENFWIRLKTTDKQLNKVSTPHSWIMSFDCLKQLIERHRGNRKKVIFLDEVPWFDTPKSGFLAALDMFWNQYCSKRKDIVLVICGSSASWIVKKVLDNRGGLHNRVTEKILLEPFTLRETRLYLENKGVTLLPKDVIQLYMCMGGIPFYLSKIRRGRSPEQILHDLFLSKNGLLVNEFDNLYRALFKNYHDHLAIVHALANKQNGLTRKELLQRTKLKSGGAFTTLIRELVACGFVLELPPLNKTNEEFIYRLSDEYSYFYLKLLEKNKSTRNLFQSSAFKVWSGYAFENVCLKHIYQIKRSLGISGMESRHASWIFKGTANVPGAQIDLLLDRKDRAVTICEAKFYNEPFEITKIYDAQLRQKISILKKHYKRANYYFVTIISPYGVVKNRYALSLNVSEILADDLLQ